MFTPLLAFELDFYNVVIVFFLVGTISASLVYALALMLEAAERGEAQKSLCVWCCQPIHPAARLCLCCGREQVLPREQRATAQPEYREPAPQFQLPEKFGPRFQYPIERDNEEN